MAKLTVNECRDLNVPLPLSSKKGVPHVVVFKT